MPRVAKKIVDNKEKPSPSLANRVSDLESFTSDTAAHIADLEERFLSLKTSSHKQLIKRVGDLESHVSDVKAHCAHLDVQIADLHKRIKKLQSSSTK